MQNQPNISYRLEYSPINLPSEFPISDHGIYAQADTPITCLHMHDCLEIGYCYEGSGIFVVENKVMTFSTGDISVINNREMHLARSSSGTVSRWSFIFLDPARLLINLAVSGHKFLNIIPLGGPDFTNILKGEKYPEIVQLVQDIIAELKECRSGYQQAVRGLVYALMVKLHRIAPSRTNDKTVKRETIERIAPALQYCATNYAKAIQIAQLAHICHTSLTNFRRLFATALGESPLNYLTRLRIQMASVLLQNTGRPIFEISSQVGYPTLSSFNRHFKHYMGISPLHWRHKLR